MPPFRRGGVDAAYQLCFYSGSVILHPALASKPNLRSCSHGNAIVEGKYYNFASNWDIPIQTSFNWPSIVQRFIAIEGADPTNIPIHLLLQHKVPNGDRSSALNEFLYFSDSIIF